ncbi:MAG: HesA/MoeB/ThiF family protein [Candidatus Methanomethylophilaceae archaeon]
MTRFSRQIPIFGDSGQRRIENATVAIVGCGGLGCNVITQLALAGVGRMVLIDDDVPTESNMNRQFIYAGNMKDTKVVSSGEWVRKLSSETEVVLCPERLTDHNSVSLIETCDVVIDCLDSIDSRLVLNRAILESNRILVHGGVDSFHGQVTTIIPGSTPCLNCILGKDTGEVKPSVSSMVALIGSLQANEALKLITGKGETLAGKLLTVDSEDNCFRLIPIAKNPACTACKEKY